ncbi:hypothetical protein GWN26_10870 [Candidatus Saccharibacteria bacterium]|nr:APC family permease [Candidatus Saccharibacteria bacterium]NIV04088.1 hypothetical protein [Calditrichia bacterium]NIS38645.1 APC family permease [Candidatus Saccharibacteria bacterium]NIV72487.1 hypothetical protein [Calditrichia bacterium]NIV99593.1 hypothetical protein [Candidatus Saccharibacteria bacterium]
MKKNIFTICFVAVGLCLAFVLFAPSAQASGCCSFYDIECTGSECTESYEGVDILGAPKALYQSLFEKEAVTEVGCVDAVSYDHCNQMATDQNKRAMWWHINCTEIMGCTDLYTPSTVNFGTVSQGIPEVKITNPVCWPKNECDAVCKTGNCWTGQEAECPSGRGYCLADQVPTELSIPIGGIGYVKDIGSYIALLYNYLIGALVIVAIVMIMYGGFRWITAAGSPEQISDAKRTIIGAVIGLLLGLFSYTLLNVINPALLQLELPRIKRIRPIYFEIQKVSCQDYANKVECEANPQKFNVTLNDDGKEIGGCFWFTGGKGDKLCITDLSVKGPGYPGNECLSGNKCNEGKCIQYEDFIKNYQGNLVVGIQNLKWCSDGAFMMPCKFDSDCKQGLYCDENLFTCLAIAGGRIQGAQCENDGDCASGFCAFATAVSDGECKSGKGGEICSKSDPCNEGQGYKCIYYDKDLEIGYCCDPYSAKLGGDRCFTGCPDDRACGEGFFCWNNLATFVKQGSEETGKRNINDWIGVCFEKSSSGKFCLVDENCKSGTCSDYRTYTASDSAVNKLLLAPGGEDIITFPEGYDRIQVGTCE